MDLMVTPEQRDKLRAFTAEMRRTKPVFVADFWNDGCLTGGCMSGGKTYWKVKGGPYAKFGVTIWPETLAKAGINPEELDPGDEYPLYGYVAHFQLNDEGKPQKVVALVKS